MRHLSLIYDDTKLVKRHFYISSILFIKFISTFIFNILGLYDPNKLNPYSWILILNAPQSDYDARLFHLLLLYRNTTQLYCSVFSNGYIQKRFLFLEALFDIGLVLLCLHENKDIQALKTPHSIIHTIIAILSFHSLLLSRKIKIQNIA